MVIYICMCTFYVKNHIKYFVRLLMYKFKNKFFFPKFHKNMEIVCPKKAVFLMYIFKILVERACLI